MTNNQTLDELESDLGEKLKRLRLNKNWDQKTLAARAGVSVRALRNVENGQGSTVTTLLSVIRALGRESWLETVAPVATINPLTLTSRASRRVRATSPAVKLNAARRLITTAEHAVSEQETPYIASAKLNAARRLVAAADQSTQQDENQAVKTSTSSRKKTE